MEIKIGQQVVVREHEDNEWQNGVVLGQREDGLYYVAAMDNAESELAPAIFIMSAKQIEGGFKNIAEYNKHLIVTLSTDGHYRPDTVVLYTSTKFKTIVEH